jgi:hypothetical protein
MPFLYFSIEIDNKGQRFMRPGENRPRTLKDNCMSKAMRAHAAQHVKKNPVGHASGIEISLSACGFSVR